MKMPTQRWRPPVVRLFVQRRIIEGLMQGGIKDLKG